MDRLRTDAILTEKMFPIFSGPPETVRGWLLANNQRGRELIVIPWETMKMLTISEYLEQRD